MAACRNDHLDIVEFLLAHPQVDVNAKNEVILALTLHKKELDIGHCCPTHRKGKVL